MVRSTVPQPSANVIGAAFLVVIWTCSASAAITRVSGGLGGVQANGTSVGNAISADGRFVAFQSFASNLVPDDTNGRGDVFVHDRQTGQTTRVSVGPGGIQANGFSVDVALSADGRFVAFSSSATNLVAGDTNGFDDVFVHDRLTGETTRVSVGPGGIEANVGGGSPSLSGDGRFVAFQSSAPLTSNDANGLNGDIFVHDRQTGETTQVSVTSAGAGGNSQSFGGRLSADGRFVVFSSFATNLVPVDTNGVGDVFVHDRLTGETTRVSVGPGGTQANGISFGGVISGDGRIVAFASDATNLVSGDTNGARDIFVHDRQTGETTRVTTGPTGAGADTAVSISGDGRLVAFESGAADLVPGDGNGVLDVFVHDRQTGVTRRVSAVGDGESVSPNLSADGRMLAFASSATNLVPNDTNGIFDAFVADLTQPPPLRLALNQSTFSRGQELVLTAIVTSGSLATPVDVYIVVQMPNGTVHSLQLDGRLVAGLEPIVRDFLPIAFTGEILRFVLRGDELPGSYAWLAAFTQPDTLNVISDIDQVPFTVGP